jgi:putative Mn2+ efflux pump MntP
VTTLLLLALALSMDAFAVAASQGATARPHPGTTDALRIGLAFGLAQALMPLIGWGLGIAFVSIVREVDHWIAFVLLTLIGGRMVYAGLNVDTGMPDARVPLVRGWGLLIAAIATSIDAAAAGMTLPLLGQPLLIACAIIGVVTFILSMAGVLIGAVAGNAIGQRAEVVGGLVLIGIGTKILIEHLFFGA